jgi:hypothetical protein
MIWWSPSCARQRKVHFCKLLQVRVRRYPWHQKPEFVSQSLYTLPPLWSSVQSSCLQIQRSGSDSRRYQIFWEVVGLEQGPLSLVSTVEGLLERKSSGSGIEIRECGRRDPSRLPRGTLYPQKLALISPTSGGSSIGIVRWRTQATEFSYFTSLHLQQTITYPSV